MKIAQVAPLLESVPPRCYGGTERVVSYLTEELVRRRHKVTLFASGDSITNARLIAPCAHALRTERVDTQALQVLQLEQVFSRAHEFDVIHFHISYSHFPLSRRVGERQLTTLHGRLDLSELIPLFQKFNEMPLVSISDAQREPMPWANWVRTVHHGLPKDLYTFHPKPKDYLAFLGRISAEKRVDRAVEIARRARMPLRIAAKIDDADRKYFEAEIEGLLRTPNVTFVGEINNEEKNEFLGNAKALLFPVDWPEPFGLVVIESLACGTPVVAFRRGSVPELISDGETGFIVDGVEQAVDALGRIGSLDRHRCRQVFEERFTSARMVADYLSAYSQIAEGPPREWRMENSLERRNHSY